ncbi:MAG TPA: histidine kinase [Leptospiraceae bacterium]|nr:histidine kinase [Leptospirales bacterium]HMU81820.1 histidine kinase [Leptospiraceae bacterium]HMX54915.1 histidine kinase [Leptospiraceae bacterium]HMY46496.1 histidine kinase [Leptospiraceae bacterium]HMZ35481.1 histidine kinase [Leptospiraceae bacterium]
MGPSLQEINDNIAIQVSNGQYLTLKTHRMTEMVEDHIKHAIESILAKTNKSNLIHVIYTILKELVINGCKANQKRVFFEERGYNISDSQQYAVGNEEYKKIFSEEMALEYGIKAKAKGLYCLIDFLFDENGLTIEVSNNTTITPQEEASMREKLKKAMGYNDIAEFYLDQAMSGGETEGAGLGLALIIILLKGENVDPKYFRIMIDKERTVARMEIPFTDRFVSKRDLGSKVVQG